jgi:fatty acid desaturase
VRPPRARSVSTLAEERERARRLATTIVSAAIALLGVMLAVFAFFLVFRGGLGFLFLAILLFALGAFLALLGFFFQLVPFRLQELADQKRERDRRAREPPE